MVETKIYIYFSILFVESVGRSKCWSMVWGIHSAEKKLECTCVAWTGHTPARQIEHIAYRTIVRGHESGESLMVACHGHLCTHLERCSRRHSVIIPHTHTYTYTRRIFYLNFFSSISPNRSSRVRVRNNNRRTVRSRDAIHCLPTMPPVRAALTPVTPHYGYANNRKR